MNSLPLGAMRSPFDPGFKAPKPAQDLLDSGDVLAFSLRLNLEDQGYPCPMWDGDVQVCIRTDSHPEWLWDWKDIAKQTHLPTLALAMISFNQPNPISPFGAQDAWKNSRYPFFADEPAQLDLTILPSGMVLGFTEITDTLSVSFERLHQAMKNNTLSTLLAQAAEQSSRDLTIPIEDRIFPGPYLASLLLHPPKNVPRSAHSAMLMIPQAEILLEEWRKTMPSDPRKPWLADLPYGLPTQEDLMFLL